MAIRKDTSMYKSKRDGAGEGTENEQRGGLGELVFGGSQPLHERHPPSSDLWACCEGTAQWPD
jgi:hypothetical protein